MWPWGTIKRLHYERNKAHRQLSAFLKSLAREMGIRGKYIYNEPGSGYLAYDIGGHIFELNEFGDHYAGLFIDGKEVCVVDFIHSMQKPDSLGEPTKESPYPTKAEILRRVERKEHERRCVDSNICPKCGASLHVEGDLDKVCTPCNLGWPYV